MRKTHIIIHHSLTKDGQCVNWSAIRRYHKEKKGWRDIGYHFGVELVNDHHEVLLGRWVDEEGAHCQDLHMNFVGIGICLVGNYDEQVPLLGMRNKALELVRRLVKLYDIPVGNVLGHREIQAAAGIPLELQKTCPGRMFHMDSFRADLRAGF